MPYTGISLVRLKEHIRKFGALYVVGIVICCVLTNLLYTTTAPRVPDELEVMLYFVDRYPQTELVDSLQADTLAYLQEKAPEQKSVVFYTVNYSDPESDMYANMILLARMSTGDGDIFIANREAAAYIIGCEVFTPLDESIENGLFANMTPVYAEDEAGNTYVAGISIADMPAFAESGAMNALEGAALIVANNSTNPEESIIAADYILRRMQAGDYAVSSTVTE